MIPLTLIAMGLTATHFAVDGAWLITLFGSALFVSEWLE